MALATLFVYGVIIFHVDGTPDVDCAISALLNDDENVPLDDAELNQFDEIVVLGGLARLQSIFTIEVQSLQQ